MADTKLQSSAEGRELLKYLIDCALPQDATVEFKHQEQSYAYTGGAGLAPDWLSGPLSEKEQRWVSACLLSRVNYFGKKVLLSMRSLNEDNIDIPKFLQPSSEEIQSFTFFEGGFFGNIFTNNPVAYTCVGEQKNLLNESFKDRICTKPSGQFLSSGEPISMCGFIITGKCSDPNSRKVNGIEYREIITTFLKG